jgi:hypothetical protein
MTKATGGTTATTAGGAMHPADSHDLIRVQGARVNNLKDVSLEMPEAPADGVHRSLGLGQELARVRHDRGRVAADDQRDLQLVRAGVHAVDGAARCRRARRADHRDPRRPRADGSQHPLDRRHGTDANAMLRILFSRLGEPHIGSPQAYSFNVPSVSGAGCRHRREGGEDGPKEGELLDHSAGCVPAVTGVGR